MFSGPVIVNFENFQGINFMFLSHLKCLQKGTITKQVD